MATLQQTLRGLPQADDQLTRGPGGVLLKKPTLQQATQQAGLQTPPTTPMAAETIGASPDAAKMAGTPQSLQTALRTKQYGRAATAEEQAAMAKSPELQRLGGLGDRVQKMVDAQATKFAPAPTTAAPTAAGTPVTPAAPEVQVGAAAQYGTANLAGMSKDLETVRNNPSSPEAMEAMVRINQQLGRDINTPMDPNEFNNLYQSAQQAISGEVAKRIIDPTTVKAADFLPELGYDTATLSGLLNISETDLQGYSIQQLQDKLKEEMSKEFSKTAALEKTAASPLEAGMAERQLARAAARELSTVGVRASESQMQNLVAEVSKADRISFMGQEGTLSDLLSDDNISAAIKDVVESEPGSELRKNLEKNSPELYKFIQRNEDALKMAAAKIQTGATQFKQIQETNRQLVADSLPNLSEAAQKILVPQSTTLQAKAIDPKDVPILSYVANMSPEQQQTISNELSDAYSKDPSVVEGISALTPEQLTKLGIGQPNSNWDIFKNYNETTTRINKIDPKNADAFISEAFTDVKSLGQAQNIIKQGNALSALGLDSGVSLTGVDPATIRSNLIASRKKVSVADAADGKVPPDGKTALGTPKIPAAGSMEENLFTQLLPVLQDGELSITEIRDPEGLVSKLNIDQMLKLEDMSANPKARINKDGVTSKRIETSKRYTLDEVSKDTKSGRTPLDAAINLSKTDPSGRKVNKESLSSFIQNSYKGQFETATNSLNAMKADPKSARYWQWHKNIRDAMATIDNAKAAGISNAEMDKLRAELDAVKGIKGGPDKSDDPISDLGKTIFGKDTANAAKQLGTQIVQAPKNIINAGVTAVKTVTAPVAKVTTENIGKGAKAAGGKASATVKNLKKGKVKW